jgi:hypothetical protein
LNILLFGLGSKVKPQAVTMQAYLVKKKGGVRITPPERLIKQRIELTKTTI